ncbi:NAD(P)/FAD-dependent oxidoreductase [Candidatus Woesearchaeota archaeon]|nr:NAD(P)/FAD-dependent oxidoreductase [Candidatus Woesearchaeota archaeon]
MRVAIVGAGPVGSFLGSQLAANGFDVTIFEEHTTIGVPEHCTGLVTKELWRLVQRDEAWMLRELNSVVVHAPDGATVEIPLHEYVISRPRFDRALAEDAVEAGCALRTGHHFTGLKDGCAAFTSKGKSRTFDADIIVGADGPNSSVAKAAGLFGNRKFYAGMQAVAHGRFRTDAFETWFGQEAPAFFAWSVPDTPTTAKVGVASLANTHSYYEKVMQRLNCGAASLLAGPIPVYNPQQKVSAKLGALVFLVGDAGGFVKATTGGGIITGILSAQLLAKSLSAGKPFERYLGKLRRELWLHLLIRESLNAFSDADYNRLIGMMGRRLKPLFLDNSRDFPSRLLLKAVFEEPGLLRFATTVLRRKRFWRQGPASSH